MEGILSANGNKFTRKKIRKVLDSVEIREKIKAAVVDEAHLIAEW